MKERKLFIVKFGIDEIDSNDCILKAFSSKMLAQCYIKDECKRFIESMHNNIYDESFGVWENDLTYCYADSNHIHNRYYYEIDQIELDESIELPDLPVVEKENLVLKEENNELRKQLAHVKSLNSAAQCFLTMYDGGWDYAKEHVIENMHEARAVLEDGEKGNTFVLNMFENWQKTKCETCQQKKK